MAKCGQSRTLSGLAFFDEVILQMKTNLARIEIKLFTIINFQKKLKIMSVKYSVNQQKHDLTGNGILKNVAKAQSSGVVDFNSICETISDRGTVTRGDVQAALDGCIFAMKTALKDGRIVRLGDFGSFRVGVKSEGTLTEKEFISSKIKGGHILFRPGTALTNMLANLTFQKATAGATDVEEPATGTTEAGSGTGTETGEGA